MGKNKPEPLFDRNGYPAEETLKTIREWPHTDIPGLIEYVKSSFSNYGRIWEEDGFLKVATGGWSGNEEIMSAIQDNLMFWAMCWESSHRGGLTVFRIPKFG